MQLSRVLAAEHRGAAVIEAAIGLPFIIMLIAGVLDFGRYYWVQNSLQLAVEETARYVMVSGTTTQATVQTYLRNKVDAVTKTSVNVTVGTATESSVNYATITATYSFSSIFTQLVPALGTRTITTKVKVPVI